VVEWGESRVAEANEHAKAVHQALVGLNKAIYAAAREGVVVEIDTIENNCMGLTDYVHVTAKTSLLLYAR
jgi:hypothetical protein